MQNGAAFANWSVHSIARQTRMTCLMLNETLGIECSTLFFNAVHLDINQSATFWNRCANKMVCQKRIK